MLIKVELKVDAYLGLHMTRFVGTINGHRFTGVANFKICSIVCNLPFEKRITIPMINLENSKGITGTESNLSEYIKYLVEQDEDYCKLLDDKSST